MIPPILQYGLGPQPLIHLSLIARHPTSSLHLSRAAVLAITSNAQVARTCFSWNRSNGNSDHAGRRLRGAHHRIMKARLLQSASSKPYHRTWLGGCLNRHSWRLSSSWGRNGKPNDNQGEDGLKSSGKRDEDGLLREEDPYSPSNMERRWKRKMDFMKRWIDKDPYDALFGVSNRLRLGRHPWESPVFQRLRAEMSAVRAEADDIFSRTFSEAEPQLRKEATSKTTSKTAESTQKNSTESAGQSTAKASNTDTVASAVTSEPLIAEDVKEPTVKAETQSILQDDTATREYDPISNRMVRKSDKGFSHYGQDLDTEVDIPVKPLRRIRRQIVVSSTISLPDVDVNAEDAAPTSSNQDQASSKSDAVRTEFGEYKSRRLPESVSSAIESEEADRQTLLSENSLEGIQPKYSLSGVAERAKLEESFAQIHSEADQINEVISKPGQSPTMETTAEADKVKEPIIVQQSDKELFAKLEEFQKLSEKLTELGERVHRLQETVVAKELNKATPKMDVNTVEDIRPSNMVADTQKHSTQGAMDETPGYAPQRSEFQKVLRQERIVNNFSKLGNSTAASDDSSYSASSSITSLGKSTSTDSASKAKSTEENTVPANVTRKPDIIDLLFGSAFAPEFQQRKLKPIPSEEDEISKSRTRMLQDEVQKQKDAMILAEERSKLFGNEDGEMDTVKNDNPQTSTTVAPSRDPTSQQINKSDGKAAEIELVQEIRDIYEQKYGEITAKHVQVGTEPEVSSMNPVDTVVTTAAGESEAVQRSDIYTDAEPSISTSSVQSSTSSPETSSSNQTQVSASPTSSDPPLPQETAVYTVLAFDPSTSEVSTTTLSAPVSSTDEAIPLTVALTRLSQPAKFLPHLRLFKDQGFYPISSSKNLLVLRNVASIAPQSGQIPAPNAPVKSQSGKTNDMDSSSASAEHGTSASEDVFRRPLRMEEFYSGPRDYLKESKARRERRERKQRWRNYFKTAGVAGAAVFAFVYMAGVSTGLKKVSVPLDSMGGVEIKEGKGGRRA